jgi:hypothetical protein
MDAPKHVDWVTLTWLNGELGSIQQAAERIRSNPALAENLAAYISGKAEAAGAHIRAQLDPPKPNV